MPGGVCPQWPECPHLSKKYTVESELGSGPNGCVYRAKDKKLGRYVALKHCKALASDDPRQFQRLSEGARTAANLSHPNVAVVYGIESCPESGDCCVVMHYADGGTLADLITAEGNLSLERTLEIGVEVCTALQYVHRREIVHGNIKPSNILFFHDNDQVVARVADFGLPRGVPAEDNQLEGQESGFSEMLEYVAPELFQINDGHDERVDLYSLGVVLYEALVGTPPFPLGSEHKMGIEGHLHREVTPPRILRPAVFAELNELILTALAQSPSDRFGDATSMLKALRKAGRLCNKHHEQAEEMYDRGTDLEKQEKWSEAVQSFQEALELNPELRDIEEKLRDARLRLEWETVWHKVEQSWAGETWGDALDLLEQLRDLDETYREDEVKKRTQYAQLQLGLASLYSDALGAEEAGQARRAIRLYVEILAQEDSYRDAAQRLADLQGKEELDKLWVRAGKLAQQEEWKKVVAVCDRILEVRRDDPEACQLRGEAQHKFEMARLYQEAMSEKEKGNLDGAMEVLQGIIASEPDYSDAAVQQAGLSRQIKLRKIRIEAEKYMSAHQWSAAEQKLSELLRLHRRDEWARRQMRLVRQWQEFEDLYQRGKRDFEGSQWDEAVDKLEKASDVARAANLDVYNYQDLQRMLAASRKECQLDELRQQAKSHEDANELNDVIAVLDHMLNVDPADPKLQQEVLERQKFVLQRRQLDTYYEEVVSKMRHADWAGARRVLNKIAEIDPEYKDVQEKRKQVAVDQNVNRARHYALPLIAIMGVGLLLVSVSRLFTEATDQLHLFNIPITEELLNSLVSILTLIATFVGMLIRKDYLSESLKKSKKLRIVMSLIIPLVAVILLILLIAAFRPSALDSDNLRNGSFEENLDYWIDGGDLKRKVQCDSGRCYVVLGDPDYSCEDGVPVGGAWIKQSFIVPQAVSTLSLEYRVFSYDLDEQDFFQVRINGTPVGQFGNPDWDRSSCDREVWDSGWQSAEFKLDPYVGTRIEVSLYNVNGTDTSWNTWTYVDDVQIR